MAAFEIRAIDSIDQETTNSRSSHFREGDFLPTAAKGEHALLKRSPALRNKPLRIAALNYANRGFVWTTEHFALTGPVSVRFGSVDALARAALGLFARPVLGHPEWAEAAEPGVEHLPRPPMPGID
jgi:hypothetical protein